MVFLSSYTVTLFDNLVSGIISPGDSYESTHLAARVWSFNITELYFLSLYFWITPRQVFLTVYTRVGLSLWSCAAWILKSTRWAYVPCSYKINEWSHSEMGAAALSYLCLISVKILMWLYKDIVWALAALTIHQTWILPLKDTWIGTTIILQALKNIFCQDKPTTASSVTRILVLINIFTLRLSTKWTFLVKWVIVSSSLM